MDIRRQHWRENVEQIISMCDCMNRCIGGKGAYESISWAASDIKDFATMVRELAEDIINEVEVAEGIATAMGK